MLWTQDRVKLAKLLTEGYEIDAAYASPEYLKGGHQIIYIIADPQQMRYQAASNMNDDKLKDCLGDTATYYEQVVKQYTDKSYTPDTNQDKILLQTWDFGVIGATYLPDAIRAVWEQTNDERTN